MAFDPSEFWASTGIRRVPTQQEYGNGFVGGPADPDPVNYLFNRIQAEINGLWAITNGLYINSSLTLYVPSQFATVQDAFDYLADKIIVAPAFVTIEMENGAPEQVITTPIDPSNPYGHRIRLRGQPITGTWPTDTDFGANDATNLAMLRSRFPSRIKANGCPAMIQVAHQLERCSNILFIGDGTTPVDGVQMGAWANQIGVAQARFENCWVHDFGGNGWRLNFGSFASGDNVGASSCAKGFVVTNMSSFQITTGARAFRNADIGIQVMDQSFMELNYGMSCDNGGIGMQAYNDGNVRAISPIARRNGGDNFRCDMSRMFLSGAEALTPGSGKFNYSANDGSFLTALSSTGTASSSPAINTAGNLGSYVKA
jgi:hypothetical protein